MSTKSSIVCTDNIHIYHECQENEICIGIRDMDPDPGKKNAKYGDTVISWDEVVDLLHQLEKNYYGERLRPGWLKRVVRNYIRRKINRWEW